MPHYWLTYGDADRFVGVAIMEAPSMRAPHERCGSEDCGRSSLRRGHELSAKLIALVPPTKTGRMLSRTEAMELIRWLDDHVRR
jgi:hypothetical protein